jgi:signal transduction histidine kinase/DNA-binding response OmpR family regulator/HAMP domain-containing protein
MMSRLSIRARILALAGLLLSVVVGTNFYLTHTLAGSATAVEEAAALSRTIDAANGARIAFGEMRYWLTDLAVSLLTPSERNAVAARERMDHFLDALGDRKPGLVTELRAERTAFEKSANEAVDEYTGDHRIMGNRLLAQARERSVKVDNLLAALITELSDEVSAKRERVVAEVALASRLTLYIDVAAVLATVLLTFVILRSIVPRLRRLIGAIEGLRAGDLTVEIPPPASDEIGAMAGTLALFRSSLEERNHLAAESDRRRKTMHAAISTISEGFVLYGPDDRIVLCNEQFRNIYPGLADIVHPGTSFRDILDAVIARRLIDLGDTDADSWIADRVARHAAPAGSVEYSYGGRWVRISERRTHDGGTVAVYSDITELKLRNLDLEQAREQADAANRTKSQFLANMSHELRTPLNAIIGYAEILQDDAADSGREDSIPDLQKIEAAGRHLLGLINDILDLSKIEAGRMDVFIEDVAIAAIVDEVRAIVLPLAAKNGNRFEVAAAADIGSLRTDRTKLKQSLLNLLSNAAKFTKDGCLTLAIERIAQDGRPMVRFAVGDTGIGMDPEQMGRIFQAFSQADASTTKKYGGTGLGLAITRHFCLLLGGSVTATSRPGEGSTFEIILPDQPDVIAATVPKFTGAANGALTVLVVDDDPTAHDLLTASLAREGYRLAHASNGEEALALAREIRPDVVTLDVIMPKVDGWSVLTALKADPELCDIPVVMVTMLPDRGMGLSLGADEFVTKPVDRARLSALLRRLVRRSGIVLVVEDDPVSRAIVGHAVEKLGLTAAEAENGRVALEWLLHQPAPDIVLLDLMMPEMDGFAFLDAFREHEAWREIPVIVLTAKKLTAEERNRLTGRTRQIIAKSSAIDGDVATAVREAVRRRRIPAPEIAGE